MADILLGFTVDIVNAIHLAAVETKRRLDAAALLPETSAKCLSLVEEVTAATENVPDDKATAVTLKAMKKCMDELLDIVQRLEDAQATTALQGPLKALRRCCALARVGQDVLSAEEDLDRVDTEMRKHMQQLVHAASLSTFSMRAGALLKDRGAREFWDAHFGDAREASVSALAESLKFACEKVIREGTGDEKGEPTMDIHDLDAAMPTVQAALKAAATGDGENVSVIKFNDLFKGSVVGTIARLAERNSAPTYLLALRVHRMPSKEHDTGLDAGFVMCRETDSLRTVRALVKQHAKTAHLMDDDDDDDDGGGGDGGGDGGGGGGSGGAGEGKGKAPESPGNNDEDIPEAMRFLVEGEFSFYVQNCSVRVLRKQEAGMSGLETLQQVCVVRNSDIPEVEARRSKRKMKAAAHAASAIKGMGGASTSSAAASEVDIDEDGASTVAESEADALLALEHSAKAYKANAIELEAIVSGDANLEHAARRAAVRRNIAEEAVTFASQYRQALARAAAAAPPGTSPARNRLLKFELLGLRARFGDGASGRFRLPVDAETVAASMQRLEAATALAPTAAGAELALTTALEPLYAAVAAKLAPVVLDVQKSMARGGAVMRMPKHVSDTGGNTRVVILGGGYAGCLLARKFDLLDGVHVTLVDPKEFFEDVIAQPKSIVYPGATPDDKEGYWPRSVLPYKKIVTQGRVVTAAVSAVMRTHVEVGARRSAVPFDVLCVTTGVKYASDIKTANPTLAYRHKQMATEREIIANAKSVLVVGGGLVGVEVAGDMKEAYKGLDVTLVQGNANGLLPRIAGGHAKASAYLESLGVNVIVGERVVDWRDSDGTYTTDTGRVIKADKVYKCVGNVANTRYLQRGSGSDPIFADHGLDRNGYLKTDRFLRVAGGLPNVFGAGDVVEDRNFPMAPNGIHDRRASHALLHAAVVATNVQRLIAGEERMLALDMRNAPPGYASLISMGKTHGLLGGGTFGTYVLGMFGITPPDEKMSELIDDGATVLDCVQVIKDGISGMVMADYTSDWKASESGEMALISMGLQSNAASLVDLSKGEVLKPEEEAAAAPAPGHVEAPALETAEAAVPATEAEGEAPPPEVEEDMALVPAVVAEAPAPPTLPALSEAGDAASETASVLETRYKESLYEAERAKIALDEERAVSGELRDSLVKAEEQVSSLMARVRKLEIEATAAAQRAHDAEMAASAAAPPSIASAPPLGVGGAAVVPVAGSDWASSAGSIPPPDVALAHLLQTQAATIAQLVTAQAVARGGANAA